MSYLNSTRSLGTTDLKLGPLGLGVAPLGNLYTSVSDSDAHATLAAGQRHGIRWFDVAPLYGHGLAEVRLGNFLREAKNASAMVSTKVGRVLEPTVTPAAGQFVAPLPYRPVFDYSRAGIERSYEESLRRLRVERVPLLLLHDFDRVTHGSRHPAVMKQVLDEALPTLQRLKKEGRTDAIGLGLNEWDAGYEILASAEVDCVLLAGRYTLLDASAFMSGFLDACARRHVAVLAGGVFNSGFLAGGSQYDYRAADAALVERRNRLLALCQRHEAPLPAAALQFTAAHSAITSVVIGARSAQEVDDILAWSRTPIPEALWVALRKAQFIPEDAPTPAAGA
jgi:D-threo-aldose 1-dehydrogenase